MEIAVRLADLVVYHPRLVWDDIGAATLAALSGVRAPPFVLELEVEALPRFGSDRLRLSFDASEFPESHLNRVRRTYEEPRLIELAGIAIAGIGLYHAGGHEIRDVALRGSGADYLVDEEGFVLEVAGRSRRKDRGTAWRSRWRRLRNGHGRGFYLCVVEFETPSGRLSFRE